MLGADLYLFLKLSGILVFIVLGAYSCRSADIPIKKALALLILAVIGGYFGSTLWYIFQNENWRAAKNLSEWAALMDGAGSVLYGWILGGTLVIYFGSKIGKFDVLGAIDVVIPWLLVAQILNRFGCFAGECCYGRASKMPWAVFNSVAQARVHPVQLYEAFADAVILCLIVWQDKNIRGRRMFVYFTGYPIARFFLEYFRGDNHPAWAGLTVPQIASVVIFVPVVLFSRNAFRANRK